MDRCDRANIWEPEPRSDGSDDDFAETRDFSRKACRYSSESMDRGEHSNTIRALADFPFPTTNRLERLVRWPLGRKKLGGPWGESVRRGRYGASVVVPHPIQSRNPRSLHCPNAEPGRRSELCRAARLHPGLFSHQDKVSRLRRLTWDAAARSGHHSHWRRTQQTPVDVRAPDTADARQAVPIIRHDLQAFLRKTSCRWPSGEKISAPPPPRRPWSTRMTHPFLPGRFSRFRRQFLAQ